jgi:hypothetical protein
MAKQPVRTDLEDEEVEDTRSDLQKSEDAEAAAHAALPKHQRLKHRLRRVIDGMKHQVKHNAPNSPSHIEELEAIHAELG